MRRLSRVDLPIDVVRLVKLWLSGRSFFVIVNGDKSFLLVLPCGVRSNSICNLCLNTFQFRQAVITSMESELDILTQFLKDSGFKSVVLMDYQPVIININNCPIKYKNAMRVLRVTI
jgi:hypothetical protein